MLFNPDKALELYKTSLAKEGIIVKPYKETKSFKPPNFLCKFKAPRICGAKELEAMKLLGINSSIVFDHIKSVIKANKRLHDIDLYYYHYCTSHRLYPGCMGYDNFPKSLCASVNDVVAHGLPIWNYKLADKDIVKVDIVFHKPAEAFIDIANSYLVNESAAEGDVRKLRNCTREALDHAITALKPGMDTSVPGILFQKYAKDNGFHVVPNLHSHFIEAGCVHAGVIPNMPIFSLLRKEFMPGMTCSLEPIFAIKRAKLDKCQANFAYKTDNGAVSAHFERTIVITETGADTLHVDL